MLVERNPYDPVQVQMPSLAQWVKAGFGLGIGVLLVLPAAMLLWVLVNLVMLGGLLRALAH